MKKENRIQSWFIENFNELKTIDTKSQIRFVISNELTSIDVGYTLISPQKLVLLGTISSHKLDIIDETVRKLLKIEKDLGVKVSFPENNVAESSFGIINLRFELTEPSKEFPTIQKQKPETNGSIWAN